MIKKLLSKLFGQDTCEDKRPPIEYILIDGQQVKGDQILQMEEVRNVRTQYDPFPRLLIVQTIVFDDAPINVSAYLDRYNQRRAITNKAVDVEIHRKGEDAPTCFKVKPTRGFPIHDSRNFCYQVEWVSEDFTSNHDRPEPSVGQSENLK